MIEQYIKKAVTFCKNKLEYVSDTIYDYQNIFNKYNTTTVSIKANMGIGKTKEIKKLCENHDKVIIVTFRVSLGQEFLNKFPDFHFYKHSTGIIDMDIYRKVIVQIDSLHRVEGSCDLLILDECQYTLLQLVQSKYRENAFRALLSYIKNTNYVISVDALFHDHVINYIYSLRSDLVYVENKYKLHKNKKVINYKNNIGVFEEEIYKSLNNNKKIVICGNSKRYIRALEKKIKNKYENKTIYCYDGVKDYDLNLEDWDYADIIMYTPTITAGISYENKHFDKVFGYFVNSSSPAEMSIQQLFRVRNLSDNEYHICMDIKGGKNFSVELDDIEDAIIQRHSKLMLYGEGLHIDNYHKQIIKDEYYQLYINVIKIINTSKNNYEKTLLDLLESHGLQIINVNITEKEKLLNKNTRKENNLIKKENELEEDKDVINSRLITDEEFKNLDKNTKINYEQKCEKKKYIYHKNYKYQGIPTLDDYSKYKKLYKEFNNLSYVYHNRENLDTFLEENIIYSLQKNKNNNIKILHNTFRNEKIYFCNNFVKKLGFNDIFDDNEISKDDFKNSLTNLLNYIKQYENDILLIWGLNKNENKEPLQFVNERLKDLYKIHITINKETKKYKIHGLDIWNNDIDFKKQEYKNELDNIHEEKKENYKIHLLVDNLLNNTPMDEFF